MAKEWTDDEVQEEIRKAVAIVREDREKATYAELHSRYGQKPEGEEGKEGGPTPPPKKDKTEETSKKKKSIWWAESEESE